FAGCADVVSGETAMTARQWKCAILGMLLFFAGGDLFATPPPTPGPKVRMGSKAFTESGILGEMLALLARHQGAGDEHRQGLTGTLTTWRSLESGEIDAYVEYTGTIRKEILTGQDLPTLEALRQALAQRGVSMSRPLGFNNTYALGMKKDVAARLGVRTIYDLQVLVDDKHYFPNYEAVVLYRTDLARRAPEVVEAWRKLEGRIAEADMVAMNARVELEKLPERRVAADFLGNIGLLPAEEAG